MELLALATLHEFQNSLVFQSAFTALASGVEVGLIKKSRSSPRSRIK